MGVWANNANNNNRHVCLAFPACKWNAVNSNAMSFPATHRILPPTAEEARYFIAKQQEPRSVCQSLCYAKLTRFWHACLCTLA